MRGKIAGYIVTRPNRASFHKAIFLNQCETNFSDFQKNDN